MSINVSKKSNKFFLFKKDLITFKTLFIYVTIPLIKEMFRYFVSLMTNKIILFPSVIRLLCSVCLGLLVQPYDPLTTVM